MNISIENIYLDQIVPQYSVEFFLKLIGRTDAVIIELGLNMEQRKYIYEKGTRLTEKIRFNLTDRAEQYFEYNRKEAYHKATEALRTVSNGLIQVCSRLWSEMVALEPDRLARLFYILCLF